MNEVYVKVKENGPYLVYGRPKITEKVILVDENNFGTDYRERKTFDTGTEPLPLCRCGLSKAAPFCDGSHLNNFDGTETASFDSILSGAVKYSGSRFMLYDNEKLCAFARFCDLNTGVWELIMKDDDNSRGYLKRAVGLCPSGRLVLCDNDGNLIEDMQDTCISVIEDVEVSGPVWLQGNIRVESARGKSYEVRNRQTLCRCGKSANKPFCDCAHYHTGFKAYPRSVM